MLNNRLISFIVGVAAAFIVGAGCTGGGSDRAAGSGGTSGGTGGSQAGSGGGSNPVGSDAGPGSGGANGGSGGAGDGSTAEVGGMGSGGADASMTGGDASTEAAAAGDGGMSTACPANPSRTDPPLTPAAFCEALLTPCKPHTQPAYKADCEAAYMKAKSQSCQTYNLCFGVVGMKMLIPYCSRAQGLGPVGNCS